ncbi:MAG: cofactor-independent phosphoglycerate mutase [Oscillospiraceae bacterium]|nr:cofactor-independent phosphoglycerate mutase [Oscillospiraceae bacterium]
MKYIILLCDGMSDIPAPGWQTPMERAVKPHMDALAAKSELGLVRTVPAGMAPGSDIANLSVLGYDPARYYTGRSPLEAANLGVTLNPGDMALRCNLVTLSPDEPYPEKRLLDYCAGDIHTAEAALLIATMQQHFGGQTFDFHPGTAYRHCLVRHGSVVSGEWTVDSEAAAGADVNMRTTTGRPYSPLTAQLTPPHDITGQVIGPHLPADPALRGIMERSVEILSDHPVNLARVARGLPPANAVWFWGAGSRPELPAFSETFGLWGAMISAVDLLKGIARLTGMTVCEVPGATGYLDTNFEGKADAAIAALSEGADYVYIHIEAPDECGHRGESENKVAAIEAIDRRVLSRLLDKLPAFGDFTLAILPDHPTPLKVRTHTADPVPYLLYRSVVSDQWPVASGEKPVISGERRVASGDAKKFTEKTAAESGILVEPGHLLMGKIIGNS